MTETTRRAVVLGASGAGLAAVLTACSGYSAGTDTAQPDSGSGGAAGGSTDSSGGSDGGGSSGKAAFAKTSSIPEGGGRIYKKDGIVVTQPNAGEFKAFTATCTHQGCTVGSVSDGTINCPCHGSKFNIADGSVANGPASKPLAAKKIVVKGGKISLA
jgi:Rieske Fe-S protein